MTRRYLAPTLFLVGALATLAANDYGIWWAGYLIAAALGLAVRPSIAGLSVATGWLAGFAADAFSEPLLKSAQVVSEIAGLPGSLGPVLILVALILGYLQGWLPALLVARLSKMRTLDEPVKLGSKEHEGEGYVEPEQQDGHPR